MASLDAAYSENSLISSQPPQVFQQAIPQFQIQYPFWHQNMRQLLMIKQQSPDGDMYTKYTIDTLGLRNQITKEQEPFYLLCDHTKVMNTKNGSNVCAHCGWFCMKTAPDQAILEKQCKHQREYSIFNAGKQLQRCGQCGMNVKFGCNINNL
jgi:hypothetical protein